MVSLLIFGVIVLVLLFGGVVLFGAPYLPTLKPQAETAFTLLGLTQGQTVLELGCGDGKVLIMSAERGYKAIGIELNPILAATAWLRTRKYRGQVQIIWGNFWQVPWPQSDAVFVFLIDRFMPKLDERMQSYGGPLASVAFRVPNKKLEKQENGVFLYRYKQSDVA